VNVKEYISSGIIESYVLGLASEAERREFETLSVQYPEIAEARNVFELALEEQLLKDAAKPPAFLKQQIQDKLVNSASEAEDNKLEEESTPVRRIGIWRWVAVASLLLLAGSIYWGVTTNKKYQDGLAKNQQLQNQLKQADEELAAIKGNGQAGKADFMMAAIKEGQQASANIYWDTASKDVYLMINNMPRPASDKQYQLWAILPDENAAPLDLGMIELKQERLLTKMKNVQNAKAFAISLEPKGGSPTPTTKPMMSSQPRILEASN